MKNYTMTPLTIPSGWQHLLPRGFDACAASALTTTTVEGIAVRAVDAPAAKRERAITGKGLRSANAARVPGSLTWSPSI